jgi:enoyl-CoA hydratase/carnithine racemase
MNGHITMTIAGGIAEITIDRPKKMNAITPEMAAELEDCCIAVDRNDDARVVLIKGAGDRAFCAGSDLNALAEYATPWHFRNRIEYSTCIRNVRKPVVAALKGWTLGGGAELALGADIRVASRSMRCGFPEVTRGWVGGGGASQLLPRLIGYGPAMKMLMLGEPIDAEEALRIGLVDILVDDAGLEERSRAVAAKLAGFSPIAVQAVKSSVRTALSAPLDAGLRYENEMNTLCFSAGDHMEGIQAFRDGRNADFKR